MFSGLKSRTQKQLIMFKKIIGLVLFQACLSCGTTQQHVITENGDVYKIKDETFFNSGSDVTQQLTIDEKENLKDLLNTRLESQRLFEEQIATLIAEQEQLQKAIDEAKENKSILKEKQKQLESEMSAKEDARQDFLKATTNLETKYNKYEKLKRKGKLSALDEEKFSTELKALELKLETATVKYKSLYK